jgi:hypothetical protein
VNKFDLIFDFTKNDQKLNYSFVAPEDFKVIQKTLDGFDQKPVLVFPLP